MDDLTGGFQYSWSKKLNGPPKWWRNDQLGHAKLSHWGSNGIYNWAQMTKMGHAKFPVDFGRPNGTKNHQKLCHFRGRIRMKMWWNYGWKNVCARMCLWRGWKLKKVAFLLVLQWFLKEDRSTIYVIFIDYGGPWATILAPKIDMKLMIFSEAK